MIGRIAWYHFKRIKPFRLKKMFSFDSFSLSNSFIRAKKAIEIEQNRTIDQEIEDTVQ